MPKDQPALAYVGKFLFFYTPTLPKRSIFIDSNIARVTAAKADRQMYIVPATTDDTLDKNFTRVGDHIAAEFTTLDAAIRFKQALIQHKKQVSSMEGTLLFEAKVTHPKQELVRKETPTPRPR